MSPSAGLPSVGALRDVKTPPEIKNNTLLSRSLHLHTVHGTGKPLLSILNSDSASPVPVAQVTSSYSSSPNVHANELDQQTHV